MKNRLQNIHVIKMGGGKHIKVRYSFDRSQSTQLIIKTT